MRSRRMQHVYSQMGTSKLIGLLFISWLYTHHSAPLPFRTDMVFWSWCPGGGRPLSLADSLFTFMFHLHLVNRWALPPPGTLGMLGQPYRLCWVSVNYEYGSGGVCLNVLALTGLPQWMWSSMPHTADNDSTTVHLSLMVSLVFQYISTMSVMMWTFQALFGSGKLEWFADVSLILE